MKQQHSIRVDDDVWAALTEMAVARGYDYRGRSNPGRVIEDLVRGVPGPATSAQPSYRLADVVASWPAKTQERWRQDEWKCGCWVKLVLDTING
jgi:hypothetical protein